MTTDTADKNFSLSSPLNETGGQQGMAPYDLARGKKPKKRKRRLDKRGSAETLREYWTGEAHGGPTHFAHAEAIRWGVPGDFMRCVAQVTEHGHMTPEQAMGYCNLLHHRATGEWPAQHAHGDKGYNPSQSRASDGKFGSGGGSAAPPAQQAAPPSPPAPVGGGGSSGAAADRKKAHELLAKARMLESQIRQLQAAMRHAAAKPGRTSTKPGAKKPGGATSKKPGSKKPGSSSSGSSASQMAGQIKTLRSEVASLRQQAASLLQDAKQDKAVAAGRRAIVATVSTVWLNGAVSAVKRARNPREQGTGRFRTFEGEAAEAATAIREGRVHDAMELIGSARALARTPADRDRLSDLEESVGSSKDKTGEVVPDLVKVGPHGYVHGWIKAGAGGAPHTLEHGPLPSKFQMGAVNYRKHSDGSYRAHSTRSGKPLKSDGFGPQSDAQIRDASVHGRMPIRPISRIKEPAHNDHLTASGRFPDTSGETPRTYNPVSKSAPDDGPDWRPTHHFQ